MSISKSKMFLLAAAGMAAIVLPACGTADNTEKGAISALDDAPVVAKLTTDKGNNLITADVKLADRTEVLRLTDLADDIRIVRLDNTDDALIGESNIWVSDNRIIMYSDGVVRQFDQSGKYLGRIGNRGQGPGEYTIAPYDIYVDEPASKIYLAQYGASKLFAYDMETGVFINEIPLAYKLNKGRVHVDTRAGKVTVAALPFNDAENLDNIWVQDFDGNVISSVTMPWLAVVPDFSNEITAGTNSGATDFDYSMFRIQSEPDTLYTYDGSRLIPSFTASLSGLGDKTPMHMYASAPQFYAVILFDKPQEVSENVFMIPAVTPMIVDRKSLHGAFANLMLDNIGPIVLKTNWLQYSTPSHFVMQFDPGTLADMIDEAADADNTDMSKRMIEFKESIDPDDNNYVIIGRWKQIG